MNYIFPDFLVLIQLNIIQISIRLETISIWYVGLFTHYDMNYVIARRQSVKYFKKNLKSSTEDCFSFYLNAFALGTLIFIHQPIF
jgi:hypothetical protein